MLIDTHVWIWFHLSPERLAESALNQIETEVRVVLSSLSIYETMVAAERGRLESSLEPETLVRQWLRSSDFVRLTVTEEIVIRSRSLDFRHADPFDRMIAATAIEAKIPLMTADQNLLDLDWLPTIRAA
jgi:PIN domain nuclease of toxin-antitoxin system